VNSRTPFVAVEVGVGEEVREGDTEGDGVTLAFAEGLVLGLMTIPLFHTFFEPLLMQVNRFPWKSTTWPSFKQVAPAFGVSASADGGASKTATIATNAILRGFMIVTF